MTENGKSNGREPVVFVALPSRPGDAISLALLTATHNAGSGFKLYDYRARPCSLLPLNFNLLWTEALNERANGITHFCMMHADVAPEPGWLAKLLAEQKRVGADVLSTVIALKDDRGLSSTGVMDWRTKRMKKFSLAEALALPPSFDAAAAGYPGHCLLMNTGLWVCDFTKPWVEKICFRLHDTIVPMPDGTFRAQCVSEDWLWSVDCARLGLKTFATTAVKVNHQGAFNYPNFVPWGSREDEQETAIAWNISPPAHWTDPQSCPTAGAGRGAMSAAG